MRDATDQMVSEISDTVDLMATRIRELETENAELQTEIADLERQLKEATP
jgi:chaperonin cofactor prefoldin